MIIDEGTFKYAARLQESSQSINLRALLLCPVQVLMRATLAAEKKYLVRGTAGAALRQTSLLLRRFLRNTTVTWPSRTWVHT